MAILTNRKGDQSKGTRISNPNMNIKSPKDRANTSIFESEPPIGEPRSPYVARFRDSTEQKHESTSPPKKEKIYFKSLEKSTTYQ